MRPRGEMRAVLVAALMLAIAGSLHSQSITGFKMPMFFNSSELPKGQTNRIKTLITGKSAQMLPTGLSLVQHPRIDHFTLDGTTNLVAISPECFVDVNRRTMMSTNVISVVAGTNQMRTTGRGYFGQFTNLFLIFSNDVRTVLRQEIAQSARAPGSLFGPGMIGPPMPNAQPSAPPKGTNSDIVITAERLHLHYQDNTAIYFTNVVVDNNQMQILCEQLTIKRTKSGEVESVLAETNVVIRNKQDGSEAMGDRAFYFVKDAKETMELTGRPAHWTQGAREGKAAMFTYDLTERIIYGHEHAMVRFPRGTINQSDWLPGRTGTNTAASSKAAGGTNSALAGAQSTATNRASARGGTARGYVRPTAQLATTNVALSVTNQALTNQFLEVTAESITSWMVSPVRTGQRMLAETNVVIIGTNDQTYATARTAEYNEQYGTLELFGNASWQQGLRMVKGEHLLYDRTNQVFLAETNAFLRVPAAEFGRQARINSGSSTNTNANTKTNAAPRLPQFVEASSDRYEYKAGYLTFYDHVRSFLYEGDIPQGMATAEGPVRIKMSNQVERVTARRKVHVEQFPIPTAKGKAVSKKLDCESLTIDMATNGQVSRIFANTNVIAQQTRKRNAKAPATYSRLVAESVFADFFPDTNTNAVREMIAERDVFLMQDVRTATGQKAVYTATNNSIELTGKPMVQAPEMRITNADVIVWDRTQQKFFLRRPSGQGFAPPPNEKRLPGLK